MAERYNEVANRLVSTRSAVEDPSIDHIVTGANAVYDDTVPYRYNGHIDCKEVTPVGTENPQELEWFEKVYNTLEPTLFEWVKTTDTSVDSEKTYGVSIGAKQSDVNKQLYDRLDDIYEVTINADDVSKVITSDANKIINKEDGYVPTAAAVGEALGANFEDSLTSTSTVKGLTANMGKKLNEIKANKNGWYEQLVSGASLSLIGDDVDHKATFFERETGDSTATGGINHSVDKGIATIETIHGHTEKFNQLIKNGNFSDEVAEWTRMGNATLSVSNNEMSIQLTIDPSINYEGFIRQVYPNGILSHKYFITYECYTPRSGSFCLDTNNMLGNPTIQVTALQWTKYSGILSSSVNGQIFLAFYPKEKVDGYVSGDVYKLRNINFIDLTSIFGAGNEPSTVEEFETWLANNIGIQDYYDYTPGTLISLNPDSLVSTGVNLYNPNTGEARVLSGKEYKITGTYTSIEYSDGTTITPSDGVFTASKNDTLTITGGNNTNTFLYLIENNNTSKTFEPYKESIVDLSWIKDIPDPNNSSKKLFPYGLLKAGNIYDEVTATKVIKRIGSVDLGTLTWIYRGSGDNTRIYSTDLNSSYGGTNEVTTIGNVICSKYQMATSNQVYFHAVDKVIALMKGNEYLSVYDSAYTDAATFKAAMSGVFLYYELATPIEVTFEEPNTHPMNYEAEDGGHEKILPENTSTLTTTSLIADIRYPLNALEAIRNLQSNFSTQGALYQTFNSLCSALNSAITTGTFAVAPDETVVGKFNFTFTPTENTQSVESNETI